MIDAAANLTTLATNEGYNRTRICGVNIFKSSESSAREPLCYQQGIIIIVQGQKQVFFDQQVYQYNADNYLVLTLPLPAECETIVTPGKPLLALLIDLDMAMLNELVRLFDEHQPLNSEDKSTQIKGLYVSHCTTGLSCVISRLTECLKSPIESDILGPGLVREILFHILSGPQAQPLFALVSHNTHLSRIERVLRHLNQNFQQQLDIEQLAGMANMSSSTFHRIFKQVTATSPIQYVKKQRLVRAKALLLDQGLKVKQAAEQVGYESPTQFSREFSRYFGQSPSDIG